jgi:transketolase
VGIGFDGCKIDFSYYILSNFEDVLDLDPDEPEKPDRDRFILSKGHACASFYSVLSQAGFFPEERLKRFYTNGGDLWGHASHPGVPGIEVSTGSLGHGLPMAQGMALSSKRDGSPYRVFALMSDGECDEGTTWETALFASHHNLDNLTVIVDYNKIQSIGRTSEVMDLEPLKDKWESFGWATRSIDGHDPEILLDSLSTVPWEEGKPNCLIANTVKGKGVSFMEDTVLWHYRVPEGDEYEDAVQELEAKR